MTKSAFTKVGLVGFSLCTLVAVAFAPTPAKAHVVVGVGVPFFFPLYPYPYPYPYPYYYPYYAPPSAYAPSPPTPIAPQAQSWYYCDNPKGYYPYVNSCRSGWRQVPAHP